MSASAPNKLLSRAIAAALRERNVSTPGMRSLAHTGIALAMLQTGSAAAVTLGKLQLDSAIGEPLRGTTTATIGKGESLRAGCITTSPYRLGTLRLRDPMQIRTPTTNVAGQYTIELTTTRPLREPMYEVQLHVDCPGASALTRSYIVMLDAPAGYQQKPPQPKVVRVETDILSQPEVPVLKEQASTSKPKTNVSVPKSSSRPMARTPDGKASINPGETYSVSKGDTLFGIAARVNERPAGTTWQVVNLLFKNNPDAFIDGDRSLIKLGATLVIPPSEIIANVKPEARYEQPGTPTSPQPERKLPARPAVVRNEQAQIEKAARVAISAEPNQAAATNDAPQSQTKATQNAEPVKAKTELPAKEIVAAIAAKAKPAVKPAIAKKPEQAAKPAEIAETAKPERSSPAKNSATQKASFPAAPPTSPLLAGLVGMLLGALLATLFLSGRRFFTRLKTQEWTDHSANDAVNAFETTDSVDQYLGEADTADNLFENIEDTADQPQPEMTGSSLPLATDEMPESHFGTIEVEFSELDAKEGQTLGFDLADGLGADTVEQPQLGETPRINLEGLGNNVDLQSELQEMLQDFSDTEMAQVSGFDDPAADTTELDATDVVPEDPEDLEKTGEITHPDLAASTGLETMRDLQSLSDEDAEAETGSDADPAHDDDIDTAETQENQQFAMETLAMKPFSLGLDLDLGNSENENSLGALDFNLDPETETADQEDEQKDK